MPPACLFSRRAYLAVEPSTYCCIPRFVSPHFLPSTSIMTTTSITTCPGVSIRCPFISTCSTSDPNGCLEPPLAVAWALHLLLSPHLSDSDSDRTGAMDSPPYHTRPTQPYKTSLRITWHLPMPTELIVYGAKPSLPRCLTCRPLLPGDKGSYTVRDVKRRQFCILVVLR